MDEENPFDGFCLDLDAVLRHVETKRLLPPEILIGDGSQFPIGRFQGARVKLPRQAPLMNGLDEPRPDLPP